MGPDISASRRAQTREAASFERFLRNKKLKLTEERMAILAAIYERNTHFDAEMLHAELKSKGGNISRATVYRTLDLLVQCRLVRKSSLGSSHANYEAANEGEHHDHLICMNCNTVIEFFRSDLETLQEAICSEHGFKPIHHSLHIFGICSACKDTTDESLIQGRVAQLHT